MCINKVDTTNRCEALKIMFCYESITLIHLTMLCYTASRWLSHSERPVSPVCSARRTWCNVGLYFTSGYVQSSESSLYDCHSLAALCAGRGEDVPHQRGLAPPLRPPRPRDLALAAPVASPAPTPPAPPAPASVQTRGRTLRCGHVVSGDTWHSVTWLTLSAARPREPRGALARVRGHARPAIATPAPTRGLVAAAAPPAWGAQTRVVTSTRAPVTRN